MSHYSICDSVWLTTETDTQHVPIVWCVMVTARNTCCMLHVALTYHITHPSISRARLNAQHENRAAHVVGVLQSCDRNTPHKHAPAQL